MTYNIHFFDAMQINKTCEWNDGFPMKTSIPKICLKEKEMYNWNGSRGECNQIIKTNKIPILQTVLSHKKRNNS